jgi:hypothetical protein
MAVTMQNAVIWDVTPCGLCRFVQEPYGVTSQKTAFYMSGRAAYWFLSLFVWDQPKCLRTAKALANISFIDLWGEPPSETVIGVGMVLVAKHLYLPVVLRESLLKLWGRVLWRGHTVARPGRVSTRRGGRVAGRYRPRVARTAAPTWVGRCWIRSVAIGRVLGLNAGHRVPWVRAHGCIPWNRHTDGICGHYSVPFLLSWRVRALGKTKGRGEVSFPGTSEPDIVQNDTVVPGECRLLGCYAIWLL